MRQNKMPTPSDSQHPVLGFVTVVSDPQLGLLGGYLVLNWAGRPLEFHCTAPVKPNRAQQILYGPTLEPYLYGEQIGRALVSKTQHPPRLICTDVLPALALRPYIEWPMVFVATSPLPGCESGGNVYPIERGALQGSKIALDPKGGILLAHRAIAGSESHVAAPESPSPIAPPPSPQDLPNPRKEPALEYARFDPPHPGLGRLRVFSWGEQYLAVLENSPQDSQQLQETLSTLDASFDLSEPFGRIREAIEEARRGT